MARALPVWILAAAVGIVAVLMFTRHGAPLPTGIPLALAQDRARRISDLAYEASFRIPATVTEDVRGRVTATFHLADTDTPLLFDFAQSDDRLIGLDANGRSLAPRVENGHITIPRAALVVGENTIRFDFLAGNGALNRRDTFLYSLFVPARASLTFPCFDQPDLKARWQLSLDIPRGWQAAANGRESGRVTTGDRAHLIFDRTPPLPTYLFAFAAGEFTVESRERGGRAFRVFHRETDRSKVDRNLDAVIDLHVNALEWMERYTGIPYPFDKFDIVLVPAFQFTGMEHPGAVYYNANSILLDPTATQLQILSRASVISHETAHMWFGDLVTMAWFNDVWMKEVFANFMAAKIVNPAFPAMNHDLRFLSQHYPGAYDVDRTEGANPIRQELGNLNEAGSLYGAIIYLKAPIVMRQLERLVGEETFRDGLREYLQAHEFGNASWADLVEILDRRSPLDISAWSTAWVTEEGRPTVTTVLQTEQGNIARLAFAQRDNRNRSLLWPQQLAVVLGYGSATRELDVALDGTETDVAAAKGLPAPDWVLPTGRGLGYGFFELDPATLRFLGQSLHTIRDPLTRGAALVTLWESMLEGQVDPPLVLDAVLRALPHEADEINLQLLLDYLRAAFWRFTAPDERRARAASIESLLEAGLAKSTTSSARAAWFTTLRSVAVTPPTIARLERIWSREERVPGLTLSEVDETDLALDLAVRGVARADEILTTQLGRIANVDRKAR